MRYEVLLLRRKVKSICLKIFPVSADECFYVRFVGEVNSHSRRHLQWSYRSFKA